MDDQVFYDKVGKVNGWDFSQLQSTVKGAVWDFYSEAAERAPGGGILLDIGTGGGENMLKVADRFGFAVGIDLSEAMVEAARNNLQKTAMQNVRFLPMAAESLQFPAGFFDAVTSRHCPFDAREAARVLKPGGVLLTQQVGEADKANLKEAFGRGQAFDERDGSLKERYETELEAAGFKKVESFEYDEAEYYHSPEDLLFLLRHTPIIPDFGKHPEDWEKFNKFIGKNRTLRGIQTNSRRFLLIAYK
ncbi:class I SAM-dependent methyltransferase [Planococcus sp. FY231025]|uniref:class I SAM-dependent methyltransferase n=1 Tax=Planococcus sp. FY231025 TaxID=3455699 RepID=UPI003F8FDF0F